MARSSGSPLSSVFLEFADPECEKPFRAYSGYLQDLAGLIAAEHGFGRTLASGVTAAVAQHPGAARISRRRLSERESSDVELGLRRAWSNLRRIQREVRADPGDYDTEANAWVPAQAYYALYHAILAFAVASGQRVPSAHLAALRLIGDEVRRGTLPYPWGASCSGCPQTDTTTYAGMATPGTVHVLSSPTPDTAGDRLAMFLRTTRTKEVERLLGDARAKGGKAGARRRLPAAEKEQIAKRVPPTTVFDLFFRLRKKAHYDEADTFVLGASGARDAAAFGQALVYATDGTVAAVEGLVAAYAGPEVLADAASAYAERTSSPTVARRAAMWEGRRRAVDPLSGGGGHGRTGLSTPSKQRGRSRGETPSRPL